MSTDVEEMTIIRPQSRERTPEPVSRKAVSE
jgi:hypothetical protein